MRTPTNRNSFNYSTFSSRTAVGRFKQTTEQLEANAKQVLRRLPVVLNEQQIKRLQEHQYASEGTTLLDPWMQIFWKRLVEYCPLWVAPNLLTIIGLTLNITTSVLLIVLTDGGKQQVNRISFIVPAIVNRYFI